MTIVYLNDASTLQVPIPPTCEFFPRSLCKRALSNLFSFLWCDKSLFYRLIEADFVKPIMMESYSSYAVHVKLHSTSTVRFSCKRISHVMYCSVIPSEDFAKMHTLRGLILHQLRSSQYLLRDACRPNSVLYRIKMNLISSYSVQEHQTTREDHSVHNEKIHGDHEFRNLGIYLKFGYSLLRIHMSISYHVTSVMKKRPIPPSIK